VDDEEENEGEILALNYADILDNSHSISSHAYQQISALGVAAAMLHFKISSQILTSPSASDDKEWHTFLLKNESRIFRDRLNQKREQLYGIRRRISKDTGVDEKLCFYYKFYYLLTDDQELSKSENFRAAINRATCLMFKPWIIVSYI
jgi:hypothetical protein